MGSRSHRSRLSSKRLVFILALIFVALLSSLGLDYIRWTHGEDSLLFGPPPLRIPAENDSSPLTTLILDRLFALGISPSDSSRFRDASDSLHLKVEIKPDEYRRLRPDLETEFRKAGAKILKVDQHPEESFVYDLWQIQDSEGSRLSFLVACPRTETQETEIQEDGRPRVAIIIDDMGYNLKAVNDLCRLRKPLTLAVIPQTPYARETAEIAEENGVEVILHLPMESMNGEEENRMDGLLLTSMSRAEIIETFEKDLADIPFVRGVNNHMGSRATGDEALMRTVLEELRSRDLFFIDSLTTGSSRGMDLARALNVPAAARDVFLDVRLSEEYISGQLDQLFRIARLKGRAVGIGHPSDLMIEVLAERLRRIEEEGVRLVRASEIVR